MKLEIGKSYFLRNGERVTVLRQVANPDYPIVVMTSSGEQQYTLDGHFEVYEESPADIVSETPPLPNKTITEIKKCLARYCENETGDVLCESCYCAVELGKKLPGPRMQPAPRLEEEQVVVLRGGGYEVLLKKIT